MSKPLNIIGDTAGQYDHLLELIKILPEGELLFVGDLIDRGPKPIEVVDFVMKNGRCVFGNHEDMMIDYYESRHLYPSWQCGRYEDGVWTANGGRITKEAYDKSGDAKLQEHLAWMKSLPYYIQTKEFFISHGIWSRFKTLEEACKPFDGRNESCITWNRYDYIPRKKFQIYGHNGQLFSHDNGMCIDGQSDGLLAAYNTKTEQVYTVRFAEPTPPSPFAQFFQ